MDTYCGANCFGCPFSQGCKGCIKTCGSPFGGKCVAAEYIKENGKQAYDEFKQGLLEEVNALSSLMTEMNIWELRLGLLNQEDAMVWLRIRPLF